MKISKIIEALTSIDYAVTIKSDYVTLLGPDREEKYGFFYRTDGLKAAIKAAYQVALNDKREKGSFINYPAGLYRKQQKFNPSGFTLSVGDLKPFNPDLNITELYGASFEFEGFKGKVTDVEQTEDYGITLTVTRVDE